MNNAVFGKTMKNIRKHRDIKLVTTDKRRNQLVSEPNYHTTKYSSENLMAIEMKIPKVKMNKPICLGMSILLFSKTLMYEFFYDYIKPKYRDREKLCFMNKLEKQMHYLINNQPDIDKIYLYANDPYEAKCQFLINKRESTGLKHSDDPKAFIGYLNEMQDVYKNIEECNIDKEREILIVFDDMIADMINSKKLNSIVTKLFIRDRKLKISVAFVTHSYIKVPKDLILNSTHIF